MNWALLFVAGLFEVGWAVGLKYTDGFTRPLPTELVLAAMGGSVWLLAIALRIVSILPIVAGIVGLKLVTPA